MDSHLEVHIPHGQLVLVGGYLSPYTRMVGVSLHLMDMPFVHLPVSTLEDQEVIRRFNPLGRIPTLVCEDGSALIDSLFIIDYLNERADASKRLMPLGGNRRRQIGQLVAIGMGSCEKLVASIYERLRRPPETQYLDWRRQLDRQMIDGMTALETALGSRLWMWGETLTQADVTSVVVFDFLRYMLPDLAPVESFPNLCRLSAQVGDLPAFSATKPQRATTENDAFERLASAGMT
jgi:glutathione S-transferase